MKKGLAIVLGMILFVSACGSEKNAAQSNPNQSMSEIEAEVVLGDDIVPYGEYHLVSAVTEGIGVPIFTPLSDSGAKVYEQGEEEILVKGKDGKALEVFGDADTYPLDFEEYEYWTAPKYIGFKGSGDNLSFKGSMMIYQFPLLYDRIPDIMTMTPDVLYNSYYREILESAIEKKLNDLIAENGADMSFDGTHTAGENAKFMGVADAYFSNAGFKEIGVRGLKVNYNIN